MKLTSYQAWIVLVLSSLLAASAHNSHDATSWRRVVEGRLADQDYSTTSPLIGVITQPHHHKHHKDQQTISGPLVSWVESAGGRVVPIEYDAPWEVLEAKFKSINGLVLPGGSGDLWYGHPFFDTAAHLVSLAKKANEADDIFPVFGICLGFETMHIMIANRTRDELLVPATGQESVANTLELTRAAEESIFFRHWTESLMSEVERPELVPTFNAHEWAVPLSAYDDIAALDDQLSILSTSTDIAGEVYVSTVEHNWYPFFATQWHPEKPPYEFSDPSIPHSRTAIDAGFITASLLVDVARLNSHKIPYEDEVKMVIQNYERHFLPAEGGGVDPQDPLPDTLWFIPEPKNARKDPEPIPDDVIIGDGDGTTGVAPNEKDKTTNSGVLGAAAAEAWDKVQAMLWRGRGRGRGRRSGAVHLVAHE